MLIKIQGKIRGKKKEKKELIKNRERKKIQI
jgi:hypothetical protein